MSLSKEAWPLISTTRRVVESAASTLSTILNDHTLAVGNHAKARRRLAYVRGKLDSALIVLEQAEAAMADSKR